MPQSSYDAPTHGEEPDVKIELRPATADDEDLFFFLYASTRQEELDCIGWDAQDRQEFLHMQYTARKRSYDAAFPGADHQVVLADGDPAGALIVWRDRSEIRLVDIAILPHHRNARIGTTLIRDLMAESTRKGVPLRLRVDQENAKALRLYQRLGFSVGPTRQDEPQPYLDLEWKPESPS